MSIIQRKKIELSKGETYSVNYEIFRSTMELVETCKVRRITDNRFDNAQTKEHEKDWAGVGSYKEALDLMNDGWSEKVKELNGVINNCKQRQSEKRIGFKNDVHGFVPIVPLAIMGVPNSMINTSTRSVKTKVVDVYYNINAGASVEKEEMFSNGRKVVELITKLENCGYRVGLNVVYSSTDSNAGDVLIVNVKSPNQLLDLKRMCFPTIHAAMLRVIGFDWISKFPIGKYRFGYGRSWANNIGLDKTKELFKKLLGETAVFIDAKELLKIKDGDTDKMLEALKGGN